MRYRKCCTGTYFFTRRVLTSLLESKKSFFRKKGYENRNSEMGIKQQRRLIEKLGTRVNASIMTGIQHRLRLAYRIRIGTPFDALE